MNTTNSFFVGDREYTDFNNLRFNSEEVANGYIEHCLRLFEVAIESTPISEKENQTFLDAFDDPEHEDIDDTQLLIQLLAEPESPPMNEQSENAVRAVEIMEAAARYSPEICLEIMNLIRKKNPSEDIAGYLAVGLLQDMMTIHGHSERLIEKIESLAKDDEQFKGMLRGIFTRCMPASIQKRFNQAAGRR